MKIPAWALAAAVAQSAAILAAPQSAKAQTYYYDYQPYYYDPGASSTYGPGYETHRQGNRSVTRTPDGTTYRDGDRSVTYGPGGKTTRFNTPCGPASITEGPYGRTVRGGC
jgi:hypothetical protein